jgi:hypothetical protein
MKLQSTKEIQHVINYSNQKYCCERLRKAVVDYRFMTFEPDGVLHISGHSLISLTYSPVYSVSKMMDFEKDQLNRFDYCPYCSEVIEK